MKKDLINKIAVLILPLTAMYLLYTSKIYILNKFSFKSLSIGFYLGILLWIIFIIYTLIYTSKRNKEIKDKKRRLLSNLRNIILLIFITILFVYRIGNSIIILYKYSNNIFNNIIYISFAVIFVIYTIFIYIINKKN